jgi:hypothetical protein
MVEGMPRKSSNVELRVGMQIEVDESINEDRDEVYGRCDHSHHGIFTVPITERQLLPRKML